jgi:multiple sugar transport system substrate-binding protein
VAHTGTVFNGIFYAFGGHFVDGDGNVDLNNEGNVAALTWTKELVDAKVIPAGLEIKDLRGLFASGQIGIIFDGDMGRGAFRASSGIGEEFDKKMGIAIIPAGETGRSETVYTEHQLAVFEKSEHKEAAVRLIEYLIGKDAMLKYHKSNAVLSARKSIATLPEMNEDYFMEVFNKQSETASPLPATNAMFDNAMNEVTKAIERIVVNNEDITTVLEETNATIREMYGQ